MTSFDALRKDTGNARGIIFLFLKSDLFLDTQSGLKSLYRCCMQNVVVDNRDEEQ